MGRLLDRRLPTLGVVRSVNSVRPDANGNVDVAFDPGGTWTTYTPTFTGCTAAASIARYSQVGKTVHVYVVFTLSSASTGVIKVSQPVAESAGSHSSQTIIGSVLATDVSAGTNGLGAVQQASAGGFIFNSAGFWGTTTPWTWASGDVVGFTATYEAA